MSRIAFLLPLTLPLAALLPSQSATTKVVPLSATTAEGPTSSYFPFVYDKFRCQQIWHGGAITSSTAILTGINFRGDGTASASSATVSNLTISLSPTTVTPDKMSTTFASNVTGKVTQVFSGNYALPALTTPKVPPAAFNVTLAWKSVFLLNGTKENLLMEWVVPGQANNKMQYTLDATSFSGSTGSATPFGTTGKFTNNDALQFNADASKLKLGGSIDLAVGGLSQAYPASLILGLSNKTFGGAALPWSLASIGAPNNNLYVSMDAVVPIPIKGSGSQYFGTFTASIPNLKILNGLTGYAQSYFGDPKANGLGLVSSHGLTLSLGSGLAETQMLGQSDSTSAAGFFLFGNNVQGGPVAQFVGTIP